MCYMLYIKHTWGHTFFYCSLLYCDSQIIMFFTNWNLWQLQVELVYQHHFSKNIYLLISCLYHILVIFALF